MGAALLHQAVGAVSTNVVPGNSDMSVGKVTNTLISIREYYGGKYHCTVDLLFDWFGLVFLQINK